MFEGALELVRSTQSALLPQALVVTGTITNTFPFVAELGYWNAIPPVGVVVYPVAKAPAAAE